MSASTPNRSIEKFVRMIKAQHPLTWASSTKWTGTAGIALVVGLLVSAMLFAIYQSRAQAGMTTVASVQKKADNEAARSELVRPPAPAPAPVARNSEGGKSAKSDKSEKSEAASERVTIVGCLERSDESFRLTDTVGEDAPAARSWKSGFLKKKKARLEVIDSVKRLNLASHVGERVSVTGTLVEKEIHAGSLQRVAASCGSPKA